MIEFFEAHSCSVQDVVDINTFLIALADQVPQTVHYMELQRSIILDEQDRAMGMDTYCVVTATGAAHYGGITRCSLNNDQLEIDFSETAAEALSLEGYRIHLMLPKPDRDRLKVGLEKLFENDPNAPSKLHLSL